MQSDTVFILVTAISIAFLHTAAGPDHYLPFIALARARNWSYIKMLRCTIVCGSGHVLSSVALGLLAAAVGWSVSSVNNIEGHRGTIAGWLMLGFGLLYFSWGIYRAYKNVTHKHFDVEPGGEVYVFEHRHGEVVAPQDRFKVTPWVMFIIFLLGPCEPMIPLLYFPVAQNNGWLMLLLIAVYTLVTLMTMVIMVTLGFRGIAFLQTEKLNKYMHAIGGFTIFICGAGMLFMGW